MAKIMNRKKIAKTGLIILTAAFAFILFSGIADASYQIIKDYKPENVPFDLDFTESAGGGAAGTSAIITILQIIAGALLYVAAPIAVIIIAMTAFNFVMYSGSSEKVESSKKQLTWAVLGLLTIMLSYSLIKFLISFAVGVFNEPEPVAPTTNENTQQPPQATEPGSGGGSGGSNVPVDQPPSQPTNVPGQGTSGAVPAM